MRKRLFLFLVLFSVALSAQEKTKKWDYPVKPGMEEWRNFQSNEEMVKACQIPEKVLYKLSTEDLIEICLQYPLLLDMFAFDNLNNGVAKLLNDFNGIRELGKRDGIYNGLLKRYNEKLKNISLLDKNVSNLEKGYYIISISTLEVLLCSLNSPDINSIIEAKNILKSLVTGYESKFVYIDYFKGFGFQTNIYSRAHIISKINNRSIELLPQKSNNSTFISGITDDNSIQIIDQLSNQLIK
ncbi:hypothetical protein FACS189411_15490 [Bacteroidia bacterium]|nr:hypothetical protein FACS189411_15490 [Bacteroidia bacterium]